MNSQHPLDIALDASIHGQPDVSEEILKTLPDDARATFNMGWHHCRHGRLLEGMRLLSTGRYGNVFGGKPLGAGTPIWRNQPLLDATVLFRGEGGFGDEICNVRFARDFQRMGAKVVVACSRDLFRLFRTLGFDGLVAREHALGVDHDYWIPAMSAPLILNLEYEDLHGHAYIPKPVAAPSLDGDFKVGLRWSGNPQFEHEQHRRFPPELMLGLSDIPGVSFYSLQRDGDMMPLSGSVFDLSRIMGDWLDTAQLIANLDLVITSCTGVAHLAAAMGVPTWIIVPIMPYYLWALPGETSPWYHSVKLFRQTEYGNWNEPFNAIRKELYETRFQPRT